MYAILRTAKLKTAGNCGGLNKHLERTMDVPNADKELSYLNRRQVGSGDLAKDVSDRIKSAGIEKLDLLPLTGGKKIGRFNNELNLTL